MKNKVRNINALFLFVLFVMAICIKTAAQVTNIPTPNALDLGKYGEIPMNYYTGRANISIPIYSTEQCGVPLNVSLSYDTGGNPVNQLPGWTGHGWTLSAGGCITRILQGYFDEDVIDRNKDGKVTLKNYFSNGRSLCSQGNDITKWQYLATQVSSDVTDYHMCYDYSPDIFTFSFMGKSGRFFLDQDKKTWRVQSDDNIKVEFDVTDKSNYTLPFLSSYPGFNGSKLMSTTIKGFTLIDDNGVRYKFGGTTDAIEYTIPFFGNVSGSTANSWHATSWYLTEVCDRFGNILYSFEYNRGTYITQITPNFHESLADMDFKIYDAVWPVDIPIGFRLYTLFTVPLPFGREGITNRQFLYEGSRDFPYSLTLNAPVYLKKITTADETIVDFKQSASFRLYPQYDFYSKLNKFCEKGRNADGSYVYNQNFEMSYLDRLNGGMPGTNFWYLQRLIPENTKCWGDSIKRIIDEGKIRNEYYSTEINKIRNPLSVIDFQPLEKIEIYNNPSNKKTFEFVYSKNPRLHLTELRLKGRNDNVAECKYLFDYYDFGTLNNDYMTDKFDSWGYYNGRSDIATSNFKYTLNGMMKRIVYPTGGCTDLEYELNDYSSFRDTRRQEMINLDSDAKCGGLRIKSITNYESVDAKHVIGKRTFTYNIPGKKLSSGELFCMPIFSSSWTMTNNYSNGSLVGKFSDYDRKGNVLPMSDSFGGHIGYSYVRETFDDGTYKEYCYTNFSSKYKDRIPFYSIKGSIDCFGELGFTRGKLLKETLCDASGKKIMSEEYTLENLDESMFVLSTTATTGSYCVDNCAAEYKYGSFFPLYYPKFNVAKKVVTHYTENDSIQDVTEYGYEYVEGLYLYEPSDAMNYSLYNYEIGESQKFNCRKLFSEKNRRMRHGIILAESKLQYAYPMATETYFADAFYYPVKSVKSFVHNTCIKEEETMFKTIQVKNRNIIVPSQVIQISDNKSRVVTDFLDYDKNTGMLLKYKELGKPVTTLQWDKSVFNRLVSKRNDVTSLLYSYNADGLLEYITFEDGQRKKYEYDAFGRLTTVSNVVDREEKPLQSFEYNYKNK